MTTYTNTNGVIFNVDDHGPNCQYLRYVAWFKPFEGQFGETFKVVYGARTKRELKAKMESYEKK